MSKQNWGGGALLAPVPPVLVSCGTLAEPRVLTVAWTGILNTKPPKTYISVRPERASYPAIRESGEFILNLAPAALAREVDLCGCRSGREIDKFAVCGFTAEAAVHLSAPAIAQCPVSIECRVFDVVSLGSHDMFLADIVGVSVDESLLDSAGALHLSRAKLLAYAHGEYFELGPKCGSFGFSVRKKPAAPNRAAPAKRAVTPHTQKPGGPKKNGFRAGKKSKPGM